MRKNLSITPDGEALLRVITYVEDDQWNAHCLEMDLVGCGRTEDEAMAELVGLLEAQITFAIYKQDASLLDTPAPKEYWKKWEKSQRKALAKQILNSISDVVKVQNDRPKASFLNMTNRMSELKSERRQFRVNA